jgi:hypothetical protein
MDEGGGAVLVALYTREFVCIGGREASRHEPTVVELDDGSGRCGSCGLEVRPFWDEPVL